MSFKYVEKLSGGGIRIGLRTPSLESQRGPYLSKVQELLTRYIQEKEKHQEIWQSTAASPGEIASTERSFATVIPESAIVLTTPKYEGLVRRAASDAWFGYKDDLHTRPGPSTTRRDIPDIREPGSGC